MWSERLDGEPRYRAAVDELWPYALGVLPAELRPTMVERFGRDEADAVERSTPGEEFAALWEEMTIVRRSAPVGAQW